MNNCLTEDCQRPAFARGMCHTCYQFWRRHNPGLVKRPSAGERFWSKVDRRDPEGCWIWLASRQNQGYGQFGTGGRSGRMALAHRVAYELTRGPIPEGLVIDHLCRNKICCNPAHLEAVTQRKNVQRGAWCAPASHACPECGTTAGRRGPFVSLAALAGHRMMAHGRKRASRSLT